MNVVKEAPATKNQRYLQWKKRERERRRTTIKLSVNRICHVRVHLEIYIYFSVNQTYLVLDNGFLWSSWHTPHTHTLTARWVCVCMCVITHQSTHTLHKQNNYWKIMLYPSILLLFVWLKCNNKTHTHTENVK